MVILKSKKEIELMYEANQIVARVLEALEKEIKPGVTTAYLDELAENLVKSYGAVPACKGVKNPPYKDFPTTICASVNDQIVHGIPNKRKLVEGDIVSIDLVVKYKGMYGDSAKTFAVGKISAEVQKFIDVCRESLYKAIEVAKVGNRLYDISHAIQSYVEKNGYSVVRDYTGHGIGYSMHETPQIPNFGKPNRGMKLKAGMTLAIEPMINMGGYEAVLLDDGWTSLTKDGSLSAHFEHTIAILQNETIILSELENK